MRWNIVEDVSHCFWECRKVTRVWRWIKKLLPIMSVDQQPVQLLIAQALIAELLDTHAPALWWRSLWGAAMGNIWLAQNQEVIPKKKVSIAATKIKIWN